ncbi:signal recognition particle-docking protein FtsY [Gardnerella sp. KA00255]|uniref:signal recognition particle-docking protein FtsY n=1 Tax=Gardnerella sp. KA00255 TaxID=2749073 RepID=UPI003BA8B756
MFNLFSLFSVFDSENFFAYSVVAVVLIVICYSFVRFFKNKNKKNEENKDNSVEEAVRKESLEDESAERASDQPKSDRPKSEIKADLVSEPEIEEVKRESASEREPEPECDPEREPALDSESDLEQNTKETEPEQVQESKPINLPESTPSRLERLRARLSKSANPFGKALFAILTKDRISQSDWEEVEDTLLLADVGTQASEELVESLRKDARITGVSTSNEVHDALRAKLLELVGENTDRSLNIDKPSAHHPSVIMMVGVNGTGKTTTVGKLARLFVAKNRSVMLAAADTFRAAAADQLSTWAASVNVPVVRSDKDGADPASVAFDAAEQASKTNVDALIVDTAGRLQNKSNLMDELGKIRRVIEKTMPVDEVLLVLDATTGQNGMAQAKVFAEAIGITGVVLTKLDGSAKGGIVISVQRELGVPVKLVGLGEGPDDLAPFEPESFVDGILS